MGLKAGFRIEQLLSRTIGMMAEMKLVKEYNLISFSSSPSMFHSNVKCFSARYHVFEHYNC